MNESRFEQLVNLYLDKEISPEEYAALKAELAMSTQRQRTFRRYRALRAAENQIICAAFKPDPADDILPEPSAGQKTVAYLTQIGGMAAAVALAVTAFVYATRGDPEQLGRTIANDLAQMGNSVDAEQLAQYIDSDRRADIMQRLMEMKTTTTVGASRMADKLRIWVVTTGQNGVQTVSTRTFLVAEESQLSLEELTMQRRILSQLSEMPGTSATVSLPGQQPFGYELIAASNEY